MQPGPKPVPIELTGREREILEKLERRHTSPQRLVVRARVILEAAGGCGNAEIADNLQLRRDTVRKWRRRWADETERLAAVQAEEPGETALRGAIETVLSDSERSGGPAKFTPEQIAQLIAVACEKPEDCGRPVSHWTARELAEEVMKRGLFAELSVRSAGRFLKSGGPSAASAALLAERSTRGSRGVRNRGASSMPSLRTSA
jgi:putative transposase